MCTSSAVFIGFMYIIKVWSFSPQLGLGVKTRICPPYPYATGKGDLNGAVSLNNRKKVGPCWCFVFLLLFVCLLVFIVVVVVVFFFLLGEFVSFNMYSNSTFVIVVYFIFLSGK